LGDPILIGALIRGIEEELLLVCMPGHGGVDNETRVDTSEPSGGEIKFDGDDSGQGIK